MPLSAALGIRLHTGWAAVMAWGAPADAPVFLERRRIELADPAERDAAFVYHAAEDRPVAAAAEQLRRARADVEARARQGLEEILAALRGRACEVCGAAVPVGATAVPEDLAAVLRSHTLVHAAEGQLYRQAVESAAQSLAVPVTPVAARSLRAEAAGALGITTAALDERLAEAGRQAGRPWAADQKEATLLSWLVLARAG